MKRIRVVFTGQMRGSTSGTDMTKAINLTREAEMNRLNVIQGALSVENQLGAVIADYFFWLRIR